MQLQAFKQLRVENARPRLFSDLSFYDYDIFILLIG